MSTKSKSREVSKQETRQALLEAGLAEIIEHGWETPSLDAICARAGYTRGAFYVHFQDRDEFETAVLPSFDFHTDVWRPNYRGR